MCAWRHLLQAAPAVYMVFWSIIHVLYITYESIIHVLYLAYESTTIP